MKKAVWMFGILLFFFSIASVMAEGSINLKLVNPVNLSSDGLLSISNIGTINLTNVSLSSQGLPQFSYSINNFDMPVPLPGTGYAIGSRPHLLNPSDIKFGYNYFNITAKSNENVEASISSSVVKSYCNVGVGSGSQGESLVIRDVSISNSFGDNGVSVWHAGDVIEIEVDIENHEDHAFDDVIVEMAVFDSQGNDRTGDLDFINSEEEKIDLGTILANDDKGAEFEFIVTEGLAIGDYRFALRVFTDGNMDSQCQDTSDDFDEFYYQTIRVRPPIPVYSCQMLNESSGYYVLQNDIISNSTCFQVMADNVTLNMDGHKLNGNGLGLYGISNNGYDLFFVYDGTISRFVYGVDVRNAQTTAIRNITFNSNNEGGVRLRDGGDHVLFRNSFFNHTHAEGALIIEESSYNLLLNNFFSNNWNGIYMQEGSHNIIRGGTIEGSDDLGGIVLDASIDNTLRDIVFLKNRQSVALEPNDPSHCRNNLINLVGNNGKPIVYVNGARNLADIDASDIILCDADNSVLTNLSINNKVGLPYGSMQILFTDNATLSNIVINNSYLGMLLQESHSNHLTNSSFSLNSRGVHLRSAFNNIIEFSTFLKNNRNIFIDDEAINNTIAHNVIVGALSQGININDESSYNLVYDNFLNNTQNIVADEDETTNYFNTYMHQGKNIIGGRFLGGNFWAQPNGKGFSETCKDGNFDGLCDKPYIIDGSNLDEIPLARKNAKDPIPDY